MLKIARLAAVLLTLTLAAAVQAADDPTGTWTWKMERGGQSRDVKLTLKLDGDKLTGSMPGRNNAETQIDNGMYKEGEISFSITREFNGNKVTSKYTGKVSGDVITGKIASERNGKEQSRDWEAKRSK